MKNSVSVALVNQNLIALCNVLKDRMLDLPVKSLHNIV